jgi:hypothetical protein
MTGGRWMEAYDCTMGRVLIIDNELHAETLTDRLRSTLAGYQLDPQLADGMIDVLPLRGCLTDIETLPRRLRGVRAGYYAMVLLDALYRFLPKGCDENSNADMTAVYNRIDAIAAQLDSAIVCVHHTSKGLQSGKNVTDVGAGAGAISRAADAHIVLREHASEDCYVMEGHCRSFARPDPIVVRRLFPVWTIEHDMSPDDLAVEARKAKRTNAAQPMTPADLAVQVARATPEPRGVLVSRCLNKGMSERQAKALIDAALDQGYLFAAKVKGISHQMYSNIDPSKCKEEYA